MKNDYTSPMVATQSFSIARQSDEPVTLGLSNPDPRPPIEGPDLD